MKTILLPLFTSIFFLFSCSTSYMYVPAETQSMIIDLRPQYHNGFFITPEKIEGDYLPIGMIDLYIYPPALREGKKPKKCRETEYIQGYWVIHRLTADEVTKAIFDTAQSMGANALMNFSVETINKQVTQNLQLSGVKVSGFAIKRQQ